MRFAWGWPLATVLGLLACSSAERAKSIGASAPSADAVTTGAGATFPNPIYSKWFDAYARETGVHITISPSAPAGTSGSLSKGPWISALPAGR